MVFTLTLAAILARPRDLIASLGLATSGASSEKRLRRSLRTRRRVGRGHDPEMRSEARSMEQTPAPRRRLNIVSKAARRKRIFDRLREGWAYDQIAREERFI